MFILHCNTCKKHVYTSLQYVNRVSDEIICMQTHAERHSHGDVPCSHIPCRVSSGPPASSADRVAWGCQTGYFSAWHPTAVVWLPTLASLA